MRSSLRRLVGSISDVNQRVTTIFVLGGNYLPLYCVYLAKVGRKGWSL